MTSLHPIRKARPDVTPATPAARAEARRRLMAVIDAVDAPAEGLVVPGTPTRTRAETNGHGDRAEAGSPGPTAVVPLPPDRPLRRRLQWTASAAAVAVFMVAGVTLRAAFPPNVDPSPVVAPDLAPALPDIPNAADEDLAVDPRGVDEDLPEPVGSLATETFEQATWTGEAVKTRVTKPTVPGPFPVVILVVGPESSDLTVSPFARGQLTATLDVAEQLASTGLYVVTVPWLEVAEPDASEVADAQANLVCAIATAHYYAADHRGDPRRMTLVGHGSAAYFALDTVFSGLRTDDRCTRKETVRPDRMIALGGDVELRRIGWASGLYPDGAASRELVERARVRQEVPVVLIDEPGSDGQDSREVAAGLREAGFDASTYEIAGVSTPLLWQAPPEDALAFISAYAYRSGGA